MKQKLPRKIEENAFDYLRHGEVINAIIDYLATRDGIKQETGWMSEFRKFYNKNDQGGSDRWLVAPWVVREFIKKQLKAAGKPKTP